MQQQLENAPGTREFLDEANILPHRLTDEINSALYEFFITFFTQAEMAQAFVSKTWSSMQCLLSYIDWIWSFWHYGSILNCETNIIHVYEKMHTFHTAHLFVVLTYVSFLLCHYAINIAHLW